MDQKILLIFCVGLITITCIDNPISQNGAHVNYTAFAQSSNNSTDSFQSIENMAPIQGWIKNNTSLWAHGKLDDSQFIVGMQYIVANDIAFLPHEYVNADLQKPIPLWVRNVGTWWANGSISDYDFLSDMQYLINNSDIKLQPTANQTRGQSSEILSNNFAKGKISIDGTILDVQIADTPDKMTEGLQFQKPLPYNQGMIFVFSEPQIVAMWMKDMQFPLDMIWFDNNGNVVHIEKNLSPCNDSSPCQVYDGNRQNTKYVLEVTSGFVDKFNVTEKSKLTILNH
ncbi:MAG TPA: DUF192 domain-containing protein [Candidatus Nitrosotalea sp.]|nr:DUF192 domain-containing protein [Nitrososphaerota archaeon]HKU32909.1 DUF192 domain-containing protein [Candidatus Nitrosotalea sp.]